MENLIKRLRKAQHFYIKYQEDPVKAAEILDKCESLVADFKKAGYEKAYIWSLIIFAKEIKEGKT